LLHQETQAPQHTKRLGKQKRREEASEMKDVEEDEKDYRVKCSVK
jgi:hypothetical protein